MGFEARDARFWDIVSPNATIEPIMTRPRNH